MERGVGEAGDRSVPSSQFCCKPKTAVKKIFESNNFLILKE
jgi:hypothetical protein